MAAQLATRFRKRTASAVRAYYYAIIADFAKHVPPAEFAAFAQKYSIPESRVREWSEEEDVALVAAVVEDRASSLARGCIPTSTKWQMVRAKAAILFPRRSAAAVETHYYAIIADFEKVVPAAEFAVFAQKYLKRDLLRHKIPHKRAAITITPVVGEESKIELGSRTNKENEHTNRVSL